MQVCTYIYIHVYICVCVLTYTQREVHLVCLYFWLQFCCDFCCCCSDCSANASTSSATSLWSYEHVSLSLRMLHVHMYTFICTYQCLNKQANEQINNQIKFAHNYSYSSALPCEGRTVPSCRRNPRPGRGSHVAGSVSVHFEPV